MMYRLYMKTIKKKEKSFIWCRNKNIKNIYAYWNEWEFENVSKWFVLPDEGRGGVENSLEAGLEKNFFFSLAQALKQVQVPRDSFFPYSQKEKLLTEPKIYITMHFNL